MPLIHNTRVATSLDPTLNPIAVTANLLTQLASSDTELSCDLGAFDATQYNNLGGVYDYHYSLTVTVAGKIGARIDTWSPAVGPGQFLIRKNGVGVYYHEKAGWSAEATQYMTTDLDCVIGDVFDVGHRAAGGGNATMNDFYIGGPGTLTKVKEIVVPTGVTGTVGIGFDLAGGTAAHTGRAQVWKNGVAVGTLRSVAGVAFTTYTEASIAVVPGDLLQLYASGSVATQSYKVKNFKVYGTCSWSASPTWSVNL